MRPINKFFFKIFILVFITSTITISCKPDKTIPNVDVGYNYFPYKVGTWMHYDVDSIFWDDFSGGTYTYSSQIKEIVESTFIDDEGNEALRIERYFRKTDTSEWIIKDVWYANIKDNSAEKVEENIRYKKLVFPIKENTTWDGNIMNYLDEETYSYSDINESILINNNMYDSTITVTHKNLSNLLEEDIRYEIYAKNIGMINKYTKTIEKDIVNPEEIKSGVYVEYKLRSYGN